MSQAKSGDVRTFQGVSVYRESRISSSSVLTVLDLIHMDFKIILNLRVGIGNKVLIICCLKGESRKLEKREGYPEDVRRASDAATGLSAG